MIKEEHILVSARVYVFFFIFPEYTLAQSKKLRSSFFERRILTALFLVTACKQVITKYKTGNNNEDRKETVAHEKHDTHTDTNPEQNETNQPFHTTSPKK